VSARARERERVGHSLQERERECESDREKKVNSKGTKKGGGKVRCFLPFFLSSDTER